MTKLVFFHRASRTFVLSDLIDSFEPQKLHSLLLRWLTPNRVGLPNTNRISFDQHVIEPYGTRTAQNMDNDDQRRQRSSGRKSGF
jgi:hypothetical protein